MKDDNDFNVQIKIWNISHKKEIMSYFNILDSYIYLINLNKT
jgi:hypothetical protein